MRRKMLVGCPVCGKWVKHQGCLCVECSLSRNTELDTPQRITIYDAVTEISESNYNRRIREGFTMLGDD